MLFGLVLVCLLGAGTVVAGFVKDQFAWSSLQGVGFFGGSFLGVLRIPFWECRVLVLAPGGEGVEWKGAVCQSGMRGAKSEARAGCTVIVGKEARKGGGRIDLPICSGSTGLDWWFGI